MTEFSRYSKKLGRRNQIFIVFQMESPLRDLPGPARAIAIDLGFLTCHLLRLIPASLMIGGAQQAWSSVTTRTYVRIMVMYLVRSRTMILKSGLYLVYVVQH